MLRRMIDILTGKPYASSIGIIGGADGPTAIFVTRQPVEPISCILPLALIILGIVTVILVRRRNKK